MENKVKSSNSSSQFIMVHIEFLYIMSPEEALMLGYLINISTSPNIKKDNKGYMRVANSYIQERLAWSPKMIRKYLQGLEEKGFIKIDHRAEVEMRKYAQTRWISLNKKEIDKYIHSDKEDVYTIEY